MRQRRIKDGKQRHKPDRDCHQAASGGSTDWTGIGLRCEVRITEQTYYSPHSAMLYTAYQSMGKQYGDMGADQLKELKRLQKENERLRKAVSDLTWIS